MADNLLPNCVGRQIAIDASCGCTLSRMTITGLTPADILDLANKEIHLTQLILQAKEAKMLGVPERGLSALLKGTIRDIKSGLKIDTTMNEQSIIMPFIQRTQSSFINDNYFTIVSASPTPGAGTGIIHPGSWDVTLGLGDSWLKTDLDKLELSFVPGSTLIMHSWDAVATKNAITVQAEIISAVNADSGATHQAKVTVVPNLTAEAYLALSDAARRLVHPTFGYAQTGANNIDDRESYCNSQRADLSKRIVLNWIQTVRTSICTQQSYEEVLNAILGGKVNDYLKGFKYASLAQQEKVKLARAEKEWMNSVMFGQAINGNQNQTDWRSLPSVLDPNDTTCQLGVKANALGIFTLLQNCNRVVDMAGGNLDLDFIFAEIYKLRRTREAEGDSVPIIDSLTDRYTSATIFETMTKYYKARYGVDVTRFADINQKITHDGFIMFNYNVYDIPDAGTKWLVAVDDYFNDLIDAAPAKAVGWDFKTRARALVFVDWSDTYVGVLDTKSVTRKNPDPATAAIYKCVIEPNVNTYQLRSKTYTVVLDRPGRHLWIYNFTDECPSVSLKGCVVPQS